jgi:hypothetical protein
VEEVRSLQREEGPAPLEANILLSRFAPSKSETLVSERERDESNLVALQVNDKGIRYSTEVFGIR